MNLSFSELFWLFNTNIFCYHQTKKFGLKRIFSVLFTFHVKHVPLCGQKIILFQYRTQKFQFKFPIKKKISAIDKQTLFIVVQWLLAFNSPAKIWIYSFRNFWSISCRILSIGKDNSIWINNFPGYVYVVYQHQMIYNFKFVFLSFIFH